MYIESPLVASAPERVLTLTSGDVVSADTELFIEVTILLMEFTAEETESTFESMVGSCVFLT